MTDVAELPETLPANSTAVASSPQNTVEADSGPAVHPVSNIEQAVPVVIDREIAKDEAAGVITHAQAAEERAAVATGIDHEVKLNALEEKLLQAHDPKLRDEVDKLIDAALDMSGAHLTQGNALRAALGASAVQADPASEHLASVVKEAVASEQAAASEAVPASHSPHTGYAYTPENGAAVSEHSSDGVAAAEKPENIPAGFTPTVRPETDAPASAVDRLLQERAQAAERSPGGHAVG